jgi:alpha-glucosidase
MPWAGVSPNLGFTIGTPWLPLGPEHAALAVDVQERAPASTLGFARVMLKARKDHADLRDAELTLLDVPLPMLAFRRGEILCVFNLGRTAMDCAVPTEVTALDFGTGEVRRADDRLTLGPLSAWFGRF